MKIKIFKDGDVNNLEDKVNEFLKTHEPLDFKFVTGDNIYVFGVMIIYKE